MPMPNWEWYLGEDQCEQLRDVELACLAGQAELPQALTRRARPRPWSEVAVAKQQAKSWFRRLCTATKPGQESPRLLVAIPPGIAAPPPSLSLILHLILLT